VVELKIWHGNEYNEKGKEEPADYLAIIIRKRAICLVLVLTKIRKLE